MRCRSFKLTSLFTYSSNQLKFVFDVAYDETKRQSHGTHGQITKFMYQSQQPPHLKFSVISVSRTRSKIIFIMDVTSLYTVIQSEE